MRLAQLIFVAVIFCANLSGCGGKPESFRDCENCPDMMEVPPGSFTMGSADNVKDRLYTELPQHMVTISKPFAVGKFLVTVGEFKAFVAATGYNAESRCIVWAGTELREPEGFSWRNPGFAQDDSHPAVCLSWKDAKAYADWLASKTKQPYRMLSEAEWEYAARTGTPFGSHLRSWFGADERGSCRELNGADQAARDSIEGAEKWRASEKSGTRVWTFASCNDGYAYTSPVGHFTPDALGLYDMFGNAQQWTADCAHDSYTGAPADGRAWMTGDCGRHVFRGGSWSRNPARFRAADRDWFIAADRVSNNVGFRVAKTLDP